MDAPAGFEFFEHTADIGLRAWGPDLASALREAARALMELLTSGTFTTVDTAAFTVDMTADRVEDVVVGWLQELLVRFELEQLVFTACLFEAATPQHVRATVQARRCDPTAEPLGREVKAITYHQLTVDQRDGCRIEIIVDV